MCGCVGNRWWYCGGVEGLEFGFKRFAVLFAARGIRGSWVGGLCSILVCHHPVVRGARVRVFFVVCLLRLGVWWLSGV